MADQVNSKQYKWALNAIVAFCYFGYAINYNLFGQTVDAIKPLMNLDDPQISYVFTLRSALYCLGAVFNAALFKYWNRQLLFGVNMLLLGVFSCLTPIIINFWGLLINQSIVGFASGGVDVASNVLILEMWEMDSNKYLQATHLCYAIGSTLSPLISAPFLPEKSEAGNITTTVAPTENVENVIIIPYLITSAVAILACLLSCGFEIAKPYKTPERSLTRKNQNFSINGDSESDDEHLIGQGLPKSYYVVFVSFAALMICFYLGIEMNLFNYLPTFIIKMNLHISRKENSLMNATFSGIYTIFRFISIFLATRLKPEIMLYMSLITILLSHIFLATFGHESEDGLWLSIMLAGAGCAWVYPTFYAFVEQRIDVTNTIGGLFMFSSSVITTVIPLIIGHTISNYPLVFVYVNLASLVIVIVFFVSMHSTDKWKHNILKKVHNT